MEALHKLFNLAWEKMKRFEKVLSKAGKKGDLSLCMWKLAGNNAALYTQQNPNQTYYKANGTIVRLMRDEQVGIRKVRIWIEQTATAEQTIGLTSSSRGNIGEFSGH